MKNGPSPCKLKMFSRDPIELNRPNSFQFNCLDNKEINTLQSIAKHFESMGEKEFCLMAQKEKAYFESKDTEFLSYMHAKDLLIR
jgi:hypothetical protein